MGECAGLQVNEYTYTHKQRMHLNSFFVGYANPPPPQLAM